MDEVTNPETEVAPTESEAEDFTEFEAAHASDDEPESFDTSEDNPEAETADDDEDDFAREYARPAGKSQFYIACYPV